MRVPGNRVVLPLRKEMRVGTSKIKSSVEDSCIFSSLTKVRIVSLEGSGISSAVARQGPEGQKVSKLFPRQNCPPPFSFCQSRALTSFATTPLGLQQFALMACKHRGSRIV